MKIGILTFRPVEEKASVEELELKNAVKARGHISRIFRSKRFQMVFDKKSPWLLYDGKPFPNYDVIINRPCCLEDVELHMSLVEQIELSGITIFNRYQPILNAKNKIKTSQILDHYGIPIPKTVIVQRPDDIEQAVKTLGGFPVIIKRPTGSFGNGVTIVESMRALKSFILWTQPMYLFQEFVKYSRGKDIRIFVVNGKVVGAMMRCAKKGEFRSNIELGGTGIPVEITEEEKNIALRSIQAVDLEYGGVDIIRSKNGPVVLEVNSNPGFKALERSTGISISGHIVDYAISLASRYATL